MELGELRSQIDETDAAIAELYEKRMDICSQVADCKIKTGRRSMILNARNRR
jgi:chorismate mutase/prephenate dehydratase